MLKYLRLAHKYLQRLLLIADYCVHCGGRSRGQICLSCYQSLPSFSAGSRCRCCLWIIPPKELSCSNCSAGGFAFERIVAAFPYEFPLPALLQRLKYGAQLSYSSLLSQVFWYAIYPQLDKLPDVIIPVPLHRDKHKLRGFNQVDELLREFRHEHPLIPIITAKRHKATQAQAKLSRAGRLANVAQAFQIAHPLNALRIAIVDDVVTSASTVNELAKLCRQQGACQVEIWCFLRAQQ